jgi:hypothetical protein
VSQDPSDGNTNPLQTDLAGEIKLEATQEELKGGRLALITDCEGSDLFTITNPTTSAAGTELPLPTSLAHATAADGAPATRVNRTSTFSRHYNLYEARQRPRAQVFPFEFKVLFVCCYDSGTGNISGRSNTGTSACDVAANASRYRPALCRWDTALRSQQLVADIADMRVTYDGVLDPSEALATSPEQRFGDITNQVTNASWVSTRGYWPNVQSARIELLATAPDEVRSAAAPPTDATSANALGHGLPADRRIYKAFTTTIALRVRSPWVVTP